MSAMKELEENLGRLELDPTNPYLLNQVGVNLFKLNRHEQAKDFFARALELDRENNDVMLNAALNAYKMLEIKEAIKLFQQYLIKVPTDKKAIQRLADCFFQLGNYPKALEAYRLLVEKKELKAIEETSGLEKNHESELSLHSLAQSRVMDELLVKSLIDQNITSIADFKILTLPLDQGNLLRKLINFGATSANLFTTDTNINHILNSKNSLPALITSTIIEEPFKLTYEENFFDLVFVKYSISKQFPFSSICAELARVVKPNGFVIFVSGSKIDSEEFQESLEYLKIIDQKSFTNNLLTAVSIITQKK